jgi:hypothetical protein
VYASIDADMACSGETSISWERPVGLVVHPGRRKNSKRKMIGFICIIITAMIIKEILRFQQLFFNQSINKIKNKLSLDSSSIGNTTAMKICVAADKQLETYTALFKLHRKIERTATIVTLLGF